MKTNIVCKVTRLPNSGVYDAELNYWTLSVCKSKEEQRYIQYFKIYILFQRKGNINFTFIKLGIQNEVKFQW